MLGDTDLERLAEGPLREIGRELAHTAAVADDPEQPAASRALRHLFDLSDVIAAGGSGDTA